MKEISLTHLLDTAICAAEAAGKHALDNKDRRTEALETFAHDVKLVLDAECQKIAEQVILSEFPEHSILGEEDIRRHLADHSRQGSRRREQHAGSRDRAAWSPIRRLAA